MLGTFPKSFSKAATSQVCPSRSAHPPQPVLAAALGLLTHSSRGTLPLQPAMSQKLPLGKLHIWEVAT